MISSNPAFAEARLCCARLLIQKHNQFEVTMKQLHPYLLLLAVILLDVTGCQRDPGKSESLAQPAAAPIVAAAAPAPAPTPLPPPVQPPVASVPAAPTVAPAPSIPVAVVRINAGASSSVKDSAGNEWLPDQGFVGGDVIERPDVEITNVPNAVIYKSEHYGMDSFSWKLPDGQYRVNLYFAETYEGITQAGDRVFSFNVQGKDFKDFDVWKAAGGPLKPVVITTDATVTDGQLLIKFITKIENPQINGIEITPLPAATASGASQTPAAQ
jgi:hypothetical protein